MKVDNYEELMNVPEGVQASIQDGIVTVKGSAGEMKRSFVNPSVKLSIDNNQIKISVPKFTKREKTLVGTFKAHLKNMYKGVTVGHQYEMKICSGHFPMNVTYNNNQLQVKNFLGEKIPRLLKIKKGADLKIDGEKIVITGIEKELVAQTAASIEKLTKRSNFDRRIFQDGIYIVNKDGKEIK